MSDGPERTRKRAAEDQLTASHADEPDSRDYMPSSAPQIASSEQMAARRVLKVRRAAPAPTGLFAGIATAPAPSAAGALGAGGFAAAAAAAAAKAQASAKAPEVAPAPSLAEVAAKAAAAAAKTAAEIYVTPVGAPKSNITVAAPAVGDATPAAGGPAIPIVFGSTSQFKFSFVTAGDVKPTDAPKSTAVAQADASANVPFAAAAVPPAGGDDDQATAFSGSFKLFRKAADGAEAAAHWQEIGIGGVKVMVSKGDAPKARLVQREPATKRVMLDTAIDATFTVAKRDATWFVFSSPTANGGKAGAMALRATKKDNAVEPAAVGKEFADVVEQCLKKYGGPVADAAK
jgi:hypothetical protein